MVEQGACLEEIRERRNVCVGFLASLGWIGFCNVSDTGRKMAWVCDTHSVKAKAKIEADKTNNECHRNTGIS